MIIPKGVTAAVAGLSTLSERSVEYADQNKLDSVKNFLQHGLNELPVKYAKLAQIYHENTNKELSYFPQSNAERIVANASKTLDKRSAPVEGFPGVGELVSIQIGNQQQPYNYEISLESGLITTGNIPSSATDEHKTAVTGYGIPPKEGEIYSDTVSFQGVSASGVSLGKLDQGINGFGIALQGITQTGPNYIEKLFEQGQIDENAFAIDSKRKTFQVGGYNGAGLTWSSSVGGAFWNLDNFKILRFGVPVVYAPTTFIDLGADLVVLPVSEADLLFASFPGTIAVPLTLGNRLYAYPCEEYSDFANALQFQVGGLTVAPSNFAMINLTYICFDACSGPVPVGYCAAPVVGSVEAPVPIVGKPLLDKLYLVFDFAKKALGVNAL